MRLASRSSYVEERVCGLAVVVACVTSFVVGCAASSPVEPGAASTMTSSAKPPQRGALRRWPESTAYLRVDLDTQPPSVELGPPRVSGMDALWSVANAQVAG